MKKMASFLIAIIISLGLFGCADNGALSDDSEAETPRDVRIYDGYFTDYQNSGVFDYNTISKTTGIECTVLDYSPEQITTKVLAGESDIDILILPAYDLQLFIDKGMYEPIDSDIIRQFNESCFDYISEYCFNDKGETILMPVYNSISFLAAPKSAIEETGLTAEDIRYLDDYLSYVRSYEGKRRSYLIAYRLFLDIDAQYTKYYCDLENGVVTYDTELYRELFDKLLTGTHILETIDGFLYDANGPQNGPSAVLLTYAEYSDLSKHNEWRAFPLPRISDEIKELPTNAAFVYINPYSDNKKAAIAFLETIAENYDEVMDTSKSVFRFPFLKKDISEYGERYMTDSDIFNDVYEIVADGTINKYSHSITWKRVDDYQNGKLTLDEAIAAYQREVEIWLNE